MSDSSQKKRSSFFTGLFLLLNGLAVLLLLLSYLSAYINPKNFFKKGEVLKGSKMIGQKRQEHSIAFRASEYEVRKLDTLVRLTRSNRSAVLRRLLTEYAKGCGRKGELCGHCES